jgi:hypothetical protein
VLLILGNNSPQYLNILSSSRASTTLIRSLAPKAVLIRLPVSSALSKQVWALISPCVQSLPNDTSEELPGLNSDINVNASNSLSAHANGRVLPVPLQIVKSSILIRNPCAVSDAAG